MTMEMADLFSRRQGDRSETVARMGRLLAALGQPQSHFAAIHVTGTNGKTTTARMIEALLREHGVHTGAFISPHLQDVRERVLVDGEPITEDDLYEWLSHVDINGAAVAGPGGHTPSFFETMTALAFSHFAREKVDVAVVEAGRGGLRDATNVLHAPVAVLGPVALDHPDLGSTTAEIAADKADIIAPEGTVVIGPQEDQAAAAIAAAAHNRRARSLRHGVDLEVRDWQPTTTGQWFRAVLPGGVTIPVDLPLVGRHHADNALLALAAVQAWRGEVDDEAAWRCLSKFTAPGRCEIVRRRGKAAVWLDGAHNPAAASALATALAEIPGTARVILVAGIAADKDTDGVLAALAPVTHRAVLAPVPNARGGDPQRHRHTLAAHGIRPYLAANADEALDMADQLARQRDVVLVTGSLYTVGAVRDRLGLVAQ
ncbi:bifunctional folylpolyglutamate synthase/dihydrofolate synthase [Stackebrandtia nassauensis]|uniref:tetrahydrofolate synthase n=1 Tax=Stackebrandtia nassauensis (strain DSM 44728 / CIP 108903 / NRRL B-16338 / NBRC 102104 / LLR-40K-21) TaxID=446470 RepID=D3PYF0_STANL|nr:Mur ligase family protein [Stackebrandtia nassauensis]ADD41517.1 FolC bifunctional protein [Stackebrandtia nassauensis DSM 44728]